MKKDEDGDADCPYKDSGNNTPYHICCLIVVSEEYKAQDEEPTGDGKEDAVELRQVICWYMFVNGR